MKQIKSFIALLSMFFLLSSCLSLKPKKTLYPNGVKQTKNVEIADYRNLSVTSSIDVELIASDSKTVIINGSENLLPFVKCYVKDETLFILLKHDSISSIKSDISCLVPFEVINRMNISGNSTIKSPDLLSNIEKISISGNSKCDLKTESKKLDLRFSGNSKGILKSKAEFFAINIGGNSKCDLNAESNDLDFRFSGNSKGLFNVKANSISSNLSGNSKVEIQGSSNILKTRLSGNSKIYGSNLTCDEIDVNLSGNSKMEVIVNKLINSADLSGNSKLYYKGDAQTKRSHLSGNSKIIKQ